MIDKRNRKNISIFIIFGMALLFSIYLLWEKASPEKVIYETVEATHGNVQRKSLFAGKVVPTDAVSIKPNIAGTISKIHKKEGDFVQEGEIIAELEVITNTVQIQEAESKVEDLSVSLELQKKMYERYKYLHENGLISISDMEKATVVYKNAEEEYTNATNIFHIIEQGYTTGLEESSNIHIRSTISGVILEIPVKTGTTVVPANILNIGTTIAIVGDTRKAEFTTRIDESEINHLYIGMPINIILRNQSKVAVPAEISYMALMGWPHRGTVFYEVKASLEVPDTLHVSSRTSANAEVCIAQKENVLIIPENAVFIERDSTFVWLSKKKLLGNAYEKRHITTGLSDKIFIEVLSGLEEGDKIRGTEIYSK